MSTDNEKRCILFFVRAAEIGMVKTRIAASVGDAAALDLYRCFVHDTLATISRTSYECIICYTPPYAGSDLRSWLGSDHSYLAQAHGDIGVRMQAAFLEAFGRGWTQAVLIGSDIPDLPAEIIQDAFEALSATDSVIGPATDGGYYLIGFRSDTFRPAPFKGIPWSTTAVFAETMRSFQRTSVPVHILPRWNDVDTLQDIAALRDRNRDSAFRDSATMKMIEHMPLREMLKEVSGRPRR